MIPQRVHGGKSLRQSTWTASHISIIYKMVWIV